MSKRVRISNDRVNSYGFRVLTDGMDVSQYERNPVLLYMHQRGTVIGYVKDLKKENGELTGEPVFDEATELSQRCKKQYEFGSLRMVSAGLEIVETSAAGEHLAGGQTRPTVTKSKLNEVSLVDIGSNDDAIVLTRDGKVITLGKDAGCDLPLLNNINNKNSKEMELKELAVQLGLAEAATEAEVNAKLAALKQAGEENLKLQQENAALLAARISASVDRAIAEKRIGEDKKEHFVELGKKIGVEDLDKTFAAMSPQVKLSAILTHQGAPSGVDNGWKKLSDVPGDKLAELRAKDLQLYKQLYAAEYGIECEIDE